MIPYITVEAPSRALDKLEQICGTVSKFDGVVNRVTVSNTKALFEFRGFADAEWFRDQVKYLHDNHNYACRVTGFNMP